MPSQYLVTLNLARLAHEEGTLLLHSARIVLTLGRDPETARTQSVAIIPVHEEPPTFTKAIPRVRVSGNFRLWDNDGPWPDEDENRTIPIDDSVTVFAGQDVTYHKENCLDQEVTGYLDVSLHLDTTSGEVTGQGESRYYEWFQCGAHEFHKRDSHRLRLTRDQPVDTLDAALQDSAGGVYFTLRFERTAECTTKDSACPLSTRQPD